MASNSACAWARRAATFIDPGSGIVRGERFPLEEDVFAVLKTEC